MIMTVNSKNDEFDESVNLLIFSELVKDVLVPGARDIKMPHFEAKTVKSASGAARMGLWEASFSPLDLFSPDNDVTLSKLIDVGEKETRCGHRRDQCA